jgi:mannuronan synthase
MPTQVSAGNAAASAEAAGDEALTSVWAHAAYILLIVLIIELIPATILDSAGHNAIVIIGVVGAWRYGWGFLHFVRSLYYRRKVFPAMEAHARSLAEAHGYPRSFLLVTSFRIESHTTRRVYHAAIKAAVAAPGPCVVIASVVEMADQRLIKKLFSSLVPANRPDVTLICVRIPGTGKRDALAYGFRAIADQSPDPNDIVAVIDGDSIVPENLVERCAPLFLTSPNVGALTTDEVCLVEGSLIFREWYSLRFAQRQILMSSMGLARRVLTLTGRMSMFRAELATDPDFIRRVELDYVDHWRIGRFKFLTGDDKSSWFWLLSRGYEMLYVPDLEVVTIEQPPTESFFESSIMLMRRWFGNMLRTNGRAIKLGPGRIGFFTWWSIIDQRLSMWTCLTGVVFALLGAFFVTPYALVFYVIWILVSRYAIALSLFSARRRISVMYPFLIYFNQIVGSLVKTYVFFRPDKQRWTRQNTVATRNLTSSRQQFNEWSGLAIHALASILFITAIASVMGIVSMPQSFFGAP